MPREEKKKKKKEREREERRPGGWAELALTTQVRITEHSPGCLAKHEIVCLPPHVEDKLPVNCACAFRDTQSHLLL